MRQCLKPKTWVQLSTWSSLLSNQDYIESSKLIVFPLRQNLICNYILFTELPWPGDSEGTFRSSSQAATCPPVYHTRRRLYTVHFNAECQENFVNTNFYNLWFDPTRNRTRAYRFSSRRSIHSTTDRL